MAQKTVNESDENGWSRRGGQRRGDWWKSPTPMRVTRAYTVSNPDKSMVPVMMWVTVEMVYRWKGGKSKNIEPPKGDPTPGMSFIQESKKSSTMKYLKRIFHVAFRKASLSNGRCS